MNNKDKIYIFGHQRPDTDSVCSAIALAYLKNKLGIYAMPRILGSINNETKYALDYFNIKPPKYLNDVRLQIKDINYMKDFYVDINKSIKFAYQMMETNNASGIAVVDEEKKLKGLVTLKDIAKRLLSRSTNLIDTSYENILEVLNAKQIVFVDKEINGNILLSLNDSTSSTLSNNTILIIGNRPNIIDYAIQSKIKLIVLVDSAELSLIQKNKAITNKVNVIKSNYDSYTTSKLIAFSNYIKKIMKTEDLITFDENSYLSDFNITNDRHKHTNYPVVNKNNAYLGMIRPIDTYNKKRKKVILVDHNGKNQSVTGLDEAEIIEIIDHHNLGGNLSTSTPINFRNMTVGSTCTIIYNMFLENNIQIPNYIAGILLSGILSDTLILKSPTATSIDKEIVVSLSNILNIDYETYGFNMFKAGSSLKDKTIEEIIFEDFKYYSINDSTIGIGQVYTTNFEEIYSNIDKYIEIIDNISKTNNYLITAIFVTDIIKNGSYIIFNSNAKEYLSDSYGIEDIEEGHYFDGFVSRKKQMMPPILDLLERKS